MPAGEGTCRALGWSNAIVERADVRVGLGGVSVAVAVCRLHHVSNPAASREARHVLTGWSIFSRAQTVQALRSVFVASGLLRAGLFAPGYARWKCWRSMYERDHQSHIGVMMLSPRAEGRVPRGRSRDEKQECRIRESRQTLHVRQLVVQEGVRYSNGTFMQVLERWLLSMWSILPLPKCRTRHPRSQALRTADISEPLIGFGVWRPICTEASKGSVSPGHGDNMLRSSVERRDSICPIGAHGDL